MARIFVTLAVLLLVCTAYNLTDSSAGEIPPLSTSNQSPLVQIFGLPPAESAVVLPGGKSQARLSLDVASNFALDQNPHETILLDGESWRWTLGLRRGFGNGYELGLDLPFIAQGGGVLDSFIEGWHSFFGLPNAGRDQSPRNRLLYRYTRNGETRLLVNDSGAGIGDIRLTGALQLYRNEEDDPLSVSLRAALKLPTGESSNLRGSGSTDLSLWLSASETVRYPIGDVSVYASAGGLALTNGDVLRDQQRNLVGFGTLGVGWSPLTWISFKVQGDGHTPFYQGSDLRELSRGSLQLVVGGTIDLPGNVALDLGVGEDVIVNTASDVAFHLSLRKVF